VVAFARTLENKRVIAAVPRLMNHRLPESRNIPAGSEVWKDTRMFLPPEASISVFRHVFTGARVTPDENGALLASDLFRTCPVALLMSDDDTRA
jgi:maltooligosyltrehalose synthase